MLWNIDHADIRFAPQADVPEKSAFDLDRAKTSSEGRPAWGPDPGFISGRDRRDRAV